MGRVDFGRSHGFKRTLHDDTADSRVYGTTGIFPGSSSFSYIPMTPSQEVPTEVVLPKIQTVWRIFRRGSGRKRGT